MSRKIIVTCTSCGALLKVPDKYAGRKGRCPSCGTKVSFPSLDDIEKSQEVVADDKELASARGTKSPSFIFAIVIVAIVGGLGFSLISKKGTDTNGLNSSEEVKSKMVEAYKQDFESLRAMKEESLTELESKLEKMEVFLAKPFEIPGIVEQYNLLLQKRKEIEAKALYDEVKKEENPLTKWQKAKSLTQTYGSTQFVNKLNTELEEWKKQAVTSLRERTENIEESLAEEDNTDVWRQSLQLLSEMAKLHYPEDEFQSEVSAYLEVCRKSISSSIVNNQASASSDESSDQLDLLTFKNKATSFIASYGKNIKERNYKRIIKTITPLVAEAKLLEDQFSEDEDIKHVLSLYKEAQELKQFWSFVEEGAKLAKGKEETVFYNNEFHKIKVLGYKNGSLYVEDDKAGKKKFRLRDMQASNLVKLAESLPPSKELYLSLANFHFMEKNYKSCKMNCKKAEEHGASSTEIAKFHEWLSKREEMLAQNKETDEEKDAREAERLAKIKERKMEIVRRRARITIKQVLVKYREGNNYATLQLLLDLKKTTPREELSKLSSEVNKQEGQGLYDIADNAYSACEECKTKRIFQMLLDYYDQL